MRLAKFWAIAMYIRAEPVRQRGCTGGMECKTSDPGWSGNIKHRIGEGRASNAALPETENRWRHSGFLGLWIHGDWGGVWGIPLFAFWLDAFSYLTLSRSGF